MLITGKKKNNVGICMKYIKCIIYNPLELGRNGHSIEKFWKNILLFLHTIAKHVMNCLVAVLS